VLALTRLGRIVIILLVAWLLQALARRVIRAFHHRMSQRTSAPEEALMSSPWRAASARKAESPTVARKAVSSACARSGGMPGGPSTGRPSACRPKATSKICRCSCVLAKS
jgi:hypothetical protein